MDVTTETVGGAQIVHVAGQLDHLTSPVFDARLRELLEAGHTRLVLDLEQVSYVSSMGLRSFALVAKQVAALRGVLVLASVRRPVQEILEIVGLNRTLTIVPTATDAVAKIQSGL